MSKAEKDYDDREITIPNERKFMLSELTEVERDIYFAGVREGTSFGMKFMCIFLIVITLLIGVSYYLTH